jgi:hypothetical protein
MNFDSRDGLLIVDGPTEQGIFDAMKFRREGMTLTFTFINAEKIKERVDLLPDLVESEPDDPDVLYVGGRVQGYPHPPVSLNAVYRSGRKMGILYWQKEATGEAIGEVPVTETTHIFCDQRRRKVRHVRAAETYTNCGQ